jgi:hypothetical protein
LLGAHPFVGQNNYLLFFALAFEMKISVAAFQLLVPLSCYLIDGLPTTGASGAGTGKHGCNFNLMSLLACILSLQYLLPLPSFEVLVEHPMHHNSIQNSYLCFMHVARLRCPTKPEISSQCSAMLSHGCHSTHMQLWTAHNLDVCQPSKLDNLHSYLFSPPKLR